MEKYQNSNPLKSPWQAALFLHPLHLKQMKAIHELLNLRSFNNYAASNPKFTIYIYLLSLNPPNSFVFSLS